MTSLRTSDCIDRLAIMAKNGATLHGTPISEWIYDPQLDWFFHKHRRDLPRVDACDLESTVRYEFKWYVGLAIIDRQSPHLRAARSMGLLPFWDDPEAMTDIFGADPTKWSPNAIIRCEEAFA